MAKDNPGAPITIKKYANRRLYNTATSEYVTLDDLAAMVRDGADFVVIDAKGGDITQSVLTQIILEQEAKGEGMLPINFLRQLICLYGDNLQNLVPQYLDATMSAFSANQDSMRHRFSNTLQDMFQLNSWEEIGKRNLAMFEQAMQIWPTAPGQSPERETAEAVPDSPPAGTPQGADAASLDTLKKQLDALQRQMDAMTKPKN